MAAARRRTRRRIGASFVGGATGFGFSLVATPLIKLSAGLVVMGAAVLLWRSISAPPPRPLPGAPLAVGFAGGFLGTATSLNGIAPVLLLARDKATPRSFLADFVASNAIGLVILLGHSALVEEALFPAFPLWLPGSLVGSWVGTLVGPRLPEAAFRRITLALVFLAGASRRSSLRLAVLR